MVLKHDQPGQPQIITPFQGLVPSKFHRVGLHPTLRYDALSRLGENMIAQRRSGLKGRKISAQGKALR